MLPRLRLKLPTPRRLILFGLMLVWALVLATGWYVATKGFTRKWRSLIVTEFKKQGIDISLRRLTLDPLRGLVAQEVKLYDARNRRRVLAVVNEMLLGVNYAGALKGSAFLDTIDLREAQLSLPLNPADTDGPSVEIHRLNARLFLPREQIYLAHAQAEVFGIQVKASGRLLNPQAYRGGRGVEKETVRRLAQLTDLLGSLKYDDQPPVLNVEFSGDLEKPSEISADVRFTGQNIRRRGYVFRQASAVARLRQGTLELEQFMVRDGRGEFRAAGSWNTRTGALSARAQSHLKFQDLMRAFSIPDWPAELVLYSSPEGELQWEQSGGENPKIKLSGRVETGRFGWRGVAFKNLSTDFSWQDGRWSIRDFRSTLRSGGTLTGDLVALPGDFRVRLESRVDPRVLAPFMGPAWSSWLMRFDFSEAPKISAELRGTAPRLDTCQGQGEVQFQRTTYEGQVLPPFTARVNLAEQVLSLFPFHRASEGGQPEVLRYDASRREARFEPLPAAAAESEAGAVGAPKS